MNTQTLALASGLAFLAWFLLSATAIQNIIKIRRTPTTWISALPEKGKVEVFGTAGQNILESPINKSPCVLWQLEVKEEKKGENGTYWVTVYEKSSSEPFEVYDDTGRIQIEPKEADLILEEDTILENLDTQTMSQLSNMGIETTNWLGSKKNLRVHERCIAPEEQVYVLGEIKQSDGCKSIAGITDMLVISDRSERETLDKLYGQVFSYAVAVLILGLIVLLFYLWDKK